MAKKWRVTSYNVQEKLVDDQEFNTELAAKSFAEICSRGPKIKQVRINNKVFKRAR